MQQLPTRLHPLFEKTKPVCFGRFVMDIPSTAIMTYGPAEAGVPIEYFPGEAATVAKRVAEHLVEVEAERRYLDEEDAAKMDNTVVLNISADLPFAQARFCGDEIGDL